MAASERRIIELVLKAVGDEELKRLARDMGELKTAAQASQKELNALNKSFMGVSAATAGLWAGNKIQEGFQALISLASDAITEMNELAEAGEAAGSGLSAAAVGGAVEFSNAIEEVSTQIDRAVQSFVGGLAPALTTLVQLFGEAIGASNDFTDAGQALGRMIINVAKFFAQSLTVIDAWANAIYFAGETINQVGNAFAAALSGNFGVADKWMAAAKASANASKVFAQNAKQMGVDAAKGVEAVYQANQSAARRTGYGTATAKDGKGGGGKSSSQRAADTKKEKEELSLYEKTMQMVNVQLVEMANSFAKADEERQKFVEGLPELSNDEWARKMEEQAAALQKAQDEWGWLADAMGQATYDIISGTESIGRAVKKMVASIIADLVRLAAQKAIMKLLGISDFGNVGSSIVGKLFGSASGNAFGAGGLITAPTLHGVRGGGLGVMGEAGPEAVLPLARNSQGQLGVTAPAANVTVNNYAGASIQTRQTDKGLQIDVIERQLADRVRRGGSALPGAIENTYGSGRFASVY